MDAWDWDERYRGADLVWAARPNMFVAQVLADARAGRALDVAAGEGRNAVWLARLGWQVTAVDFSAVGLAKARAWAESEGVHDLLHTQVVDVTTWVPTADFDVVLVAYLQVPPEQRSSVMRMAATAVAPGGRLLVVAHDSSNLEHGHGGPQEPDVLYTADDVLADIESVEAVWHVDWAGVVERPVAEAERPARDALVVLRRAAG